MSGRGTRSTVPLPVPWLAAVAAGWLGVVAGQGCGLGYIEINPEQVLKFTIQNATLDTAEVTIGVQSQAPADGSEGTAGAAVSSTTNTTIRVPAGSSADGGIRCGERVTLSVNLSGGTVTRGVELTGAGTGTPGFDSDTLGAGGERILLAGTHFRCDDTILVQLAGADRGEVAVLLPGTSPPSPPSQPDGGAPDDGSTGPDGVTVRLENATATAADVVMTLQNPDGTGEPRIQPTVRVPAGEFTSGQIECGATLTVAAAMADPDFSAVLLTGAGTGTEGFDSASVGLSGERLLLFGEHYACGETVVVRMTDDGSGIGPSTRDTPLGQVAVFADASAVPDPDLPDLAAPDDGGGQTEQVTLVVVNAVESTVQINFATGSGSLAASGGTDVSTELDVRVPPGAASVGTGVCAQEYVLAAAHLESTGSTITTATDAGPFAGGGNVNFHGVVLTGDGTGTDGFDGNSIAILRGRLLQLGTHFQCGDTITVAVTATNNQIQLDDTGSPVLDEFGNPTINYNVGEGVVTVSPG